MDGKAKWGAAGLVLGIAVALTVPSIAQTPPPADGTDARTVTVQGTATIRSDPDEAIVGLGVRTDADTAEAAMSQNATRMQDVIAAIRHAGVAEDDISTSSISLYPTYDTAGTSVVGYTAENQVQATVRDMNAIGRVIDQAVAAGANVTSGISFGLSDSNAGVHDALARAVEDAKTKAEVLAEASDAQLGIVLHVVEAGPPSPMPLMRDYAAAEAGASTPVQTPTIETQVGVSVTWSLV